LDWKYVLILKEGRQPTRWDETIKLLSFSRTNRARHRLGAGGKAGLQDFRWGENVLLGAFQTNVILSGEITPEAATLYACITNFCAGCSNPLDFNLPRVSATTL
jgi:hypothetical protein